MSFCFFLLELERISGRILVKFDTRDPQGVFIFIYFSIREVCFQKYVRAYYHGIISIHKTKLQMKLICIIEVRTVGRILNVFVLRGIYKRNVAAFNYAGT